MIILQETPFSKDDVPGCMLSCLIERSGMLLGVDLLSGQLHSWSQNGRSTQLPLSQKYDKLTYCAEAQCYFSISKGSGSIYVLDESFQEVDRIRIRLAKPGVSAADLWFDPDSNLLWLVFPETIFRFNSNGDCLGAFMTAPQDVEYSAVCTHGDFLFVAYQKAACSYVASYTRSGAFLQRVSLGCEYSVRNLQVIAEGDALLLRVFAVKKRRFPYVLTVELNPGAPTPAFSVECVSEAPELYSTCHIDREPGQ